MRPGAIPAIPTRSSWGRRAATRWAHRSSSDARAERPFVDVNLTSLWWPQGAFLPWDLAVREKRYLFPDHRQDVATPGAGWHPVPPNMAKGPQQQPDSAEIAALTAVPSGPPNSGARARPLLS